MTATRLAFPSLEPGTLYDDLDTAVWAACCLSGLHANGATVYQRTGSVELYAIGCRARRPDGVSWSLSVSGEWTSVYTITRGDTR